MLIGQQGAAQNTDATWRVGDDHLSGEENMNPIRKMPKSRDISQLRAFLGCCQQLSNYVKDYYAIIASHLGYPNRIDYEQETKGPQRER